MLAPNFCACVYAILILVPAPMPMPNLYAHSCYHASCSRIYHAYIFLLDTGTRLSLIYTRR
ncbi:hypothetical protein C2G38_2059325 [Gigaspora rosea]|uniref:Secreted protein n=1 Tax=Gigaspora rosea TaxID=44941 RepID=A0A397W143_9GLOM|nr:hypothetical protein C2G38_2059325 [Gigaspora rosea]